MNALQVPYIIMGALDMPFGLLVAYYLGRGDYKRFVISLILYIGWSALLSWVFLRLFGE